MLPPRDTLPTGHRDCDAALELLEETVAIGKRTVDTATVRVERITTLREQRVEEHLAQDRVEVERVPIGRVVEATPPVRQEEDVTIIPVMEEVLVVETRLVLKEEVRIRRVRTTQLHSETVQLRDQTATITRTDVQDTPKADAGSIGSAPNHTQASSIPEPVEG